MCVCVCVCVCLLSCVCVRMRVRMCVCVRVAEILVSYTYNIKIIVSPHGSGYSYIFISVWEKDSTSEQLLLLWSRDVICVGSCYQYTRYILRTRVILTWCRRDINILNTLLLSYTLIIAISLLLMLGTRVISIMSIMCYWCYRHESLVLRIHVISIVDMCF